VAEKQRRGKIGETSGISKKMTVLQSSPVLSLQPVRLKIETIVDRRRPVSKKAGCRERGLIRKKR